MKFESVKTPVGFISGRAALYLRDMKLDVDTDLLDFSCEADSTMCSGLDSEVGFFDIKIEAERTKSIRYFELDHYPLEQLVRMETNIEVVTNSELLERLRSSELDNKVGLMHRHFVLSFYNQVVELISTGITIEPKLLRNNTP